MHCYTSLQFHYLPSVIFKHHETEYETRCTFHCFCHSHFVYSAFSCKSNTISCNSKFNSANACDQEICMSHTYSVELHLLGEILLLHRFLGSCHQNERCLWKTSNGFFFYEFHSVCNFLAAKALQ